MHDDDEEAKGTTLLGLKRDEDTNTSGHLRNFYIVPKKIDSIRRMVQGSISGIFWCVAASPPFGRNGFRAIRKRLVGSRYTN